MADLEILALNESTPRIEAAQSGDRYLARRVIVTQLGTITADQPQELSATWNNAGVTFKGRRVVITDTASAAGSLVDEIVVNGSTVFSVRKNGVLSIPGQTYANAALIIGSGYINQENASLTFHGSATSGQPHFQVRSTWINIFGGLPLTFASVTTPETYLYGTETPNTLALRNATNPQTLRLYNTFTDASNYERFSANWSSNVCYLRTQNAGTGSARLLVPVTGATTVASLPSASTAGAGARSTVTDANATTFQSIVAGGGSNVVPVYSDGTNWRIG